MPVMSDPVPADPVRCLVAGHVGTSVPTTDQKATESPAWMVRGVVRGAERRRVVRLKWLRLSCAALLLLVEAVVAASCFPHNPSGRGFDPHPPHLSHEASRWLQLLARCRFCDFDGVTLNA